MKIILAGYNVDTDVLEDLKKSSRERQDVTPETLSASYARISRDPRQIDELRKAAREEVEKSRKSNQSIIFKMGHHSVAEHAVFNFDIIGVSRLAIEEIEHFRLCSFTEKSQRYITLANDFVIPDEIKGTKHEEMFKNIIGMQNELYHKLFGILREYVYKKYSELAKDSKNQNLLEGWAKEDARYITSLATQGQLGFTVNARNLELMLRRFAGSQSSEVRDIGRRLWESVERVAPSIILFYKANDFDQNTYPDLKEAIKKSTAVKNLKPSVLDSQAVSLVDYNKDADDMTLSAIAHTVSGASFNDCMGIIKRMSAEDKKGIIKQSFKRMEFYDSTLREFEYAGLTYEIVLSASCFAQLKRHRLATLTCQEYDPKLGVTIPQSIIDIGMEAEFMEVVKRTEDAYEKIKNDIPLSASYILTNAHRRRVLFGCNARELYHISRLREDNHAQWDIRQVSAEMAEQAKKVMPLTMLLICGKDKYHEKYKEVFDCMPKMVSMS